MTQNRFLKSVTNAAKDRDIALPWQRGATRAAFIKKRLKAEPSRKSA